MHRHVFPAGFLKCKLLNYTTWQTALNNETWDQKYTIAQATCNTNAVVVSYLVPEPSAIVMALIGIPGVIAVTAPQRRRRRSGWPS